MDTGKIPPKTRLALVYLTENGLNKCLIFFKIFHFGQVLWLVCLFIINVLDFAANPSMYICIQNINGVHGCMGVI